ncbi:thermonuclease family protein [Candidatus Peregrinibacteria bacterium]|nr:thermonuclease family protein [Candidatus Peregrinibacteria bacterium]
MNPIQNTNIKPTQPPQKIRTWPLILIALAGLVSVISLILLIPQYLQKPLSQLQTSILQISFQGTPPGTTQTPPLTESALFSASDAPQYKVTRVVDGDTIVVNINGQDEKIRLIGVNTPESVDQRRPVECFGLEASNYTKSLLENQNVILESDPTQGNTDKYGRLLRYIFLPDGTNINLHLIQSGYAHEYTYNKPYKYQNQFKLAQTQAEASQKGLWSPNTCNP